MYYSYRRRHGARIFIQEPFIDLTTYFDNHYMITSNTLRKRLLRMDNLRPEDATKLAQVAEETKHAYAKDEDLQKLKEMKRKIKDWRQYESQRWRKYERRNNIMKSTRLPSIPLSRDLLYDFVAERTGIYEKINKKADTPRSYISQISYRSKDLLYTEERFLVECPHDSGDDDIDEKEKEASTSDNQTNTIDEVSSTCSSSPLTTQVSSYKTRVGRTVKPPAWMRDYDRWILILITMCSLFIE